MKRYTAIATLFFALKAVFSPDYVLAQRNDSLSDLRNKLLRMTPETPWTKVSAVPLRFNAFHTQGIVKIGAFFYMTAVEVSRWPKKYPAPQGKMDRDTGVGQGHIFKFDKDGNLLQDVLVGTGDVYHPGGIDYDGQYIWIPLTEYRPHSFSIIYRFDPKTSSVTEVLRFPDSIGAIVHNTDANTLVGANWDARKFYTWKLDKDGKVTNANAQPDKLGVSNPSFYVAFQDCKYLGDNLMFGSGQNAYENGNMKIRAGGWEIFDLKDFRPRRQIPVKLWSQSGGTMLNNPCAVEATPNGIRAYFVPEDDDKAVLYTYDLSIDPSHEH